MKNFWKLTVGVLSLLKAASAQANPAYELSTLLGTPNNSMPYVQEMLKSHVGLVPGMNFTDYTTGVLYFASRNGTQSAQTIQVLQEGGNASLSDVTQAIEMASASSKIVLAPLSGDGVEEMCARMYLKPDTAFLVTLGDVGYTFSPFNTKCAARNILFVTVLNEELSDLGEFASFGPLVRLAVPGMDLSAPVDGDRRVSYLSDGFGMAVAAGKMSEISRRRPELKGAELIRQLIEEAEVLPILRGRVTGARAIRNFTR
ncbi:MAG TPA: hypothetical protein VIH99_04155 [Bdellovibrionota bacterium]|jgi:hypothetical protein